MFCRIFPCLNTSRDTNEHFCIFSVELCRSDWTSPLVLCGATMTRSCYVEIVFHFRISTNTFGLQKKKYVFFFKFIIYFHTPAGTQMNVNFCEHQIKTILFTRYFINFFSICFTFSWKCYWAGDVFKPNSSLPKLAFKICKFVNPSKWNTSFSCADSKIQLNSSFRESESEEPAGGHMNDSHSSLAPNDSHCALFPF